LATCFAEGRAVAWTAPFDVATGPDVFHADQAALEAAITAAYPGFTATIDLTPDGSIFPELCLTGEGECPEGPFLYDCENPTTGCRVEEVDCRIGDTIASQAIGNEPPVTCSNDPSVIPSGTPIPMPVTAPGTTGFYYAAVFDTTDVVGILIENVGAGFPTLINTCYVQNSNFTRTLIDGKSNNFNVSISPGGSHSIGCTSGFEGMTECPPTLSEYETNPSAFPGTLGIMIGASIDAELQFTCYKKV